MKYRIRREAILGYQSHFTPNMKVRATAVFLVERSHLGIFWDRLGTPFDTLEEAEAFLTAWKRETRAEKVYARD